MIPKQLQLMGHALSVKIVPAKNWSDDDAMGFFNSQNMTISVIAGLDAQRTQQIFCHELVHAILHCMGEEKLNCNEKFVDVFGSLLHQAWTSVK